MLGRWIRFAAPVSVWALVAAFVGLKGIQYVAKVATFLPLRVKARPTGGTDRFERLGDWVVRNRRPLLWGSSLVALALVAGIVAVMAHLKRAAPIQ